MYFTYCSIILYFSARPVYPLQIFDEKADDLIDKLLVNVYTARSRLHSPLEKPIITPESQVKSTTTVRYVATKPKIKVNYLNLTEKEFIKKRGQTKVLEMLEFDNSPPNFEIDELHIQSRRFDAIRNNTFTKDAKALREYYFYDEYADKAYRHKKRTLRLMEQFIHETRYKLPYTQLLRKKYILQPRYRIAYCFSLLDNLRHQQMILFSTMKNSLRHYQSLYGHLKLYQKIVRLDVDIRDLIAYIKKLNWHRLQTEEPFYFEDVKLLQQ